MVSRVPASGIIQLHDLYILESEACLTLRVPLSRSDLVGSKLIYGRLNYVIYSMCFICLLAGYDSRG